MGLKKPYNERTDAQKVQANWIKTRGLFDREDWSMSVVRAAVCVELAANLAIRAIYRKSKSAAEIDKLLIDCNGAARKFKDHIVPHFNDTGRKEEAKRLNKLRVEIGGTRNLVAHGGIFLNEDEATELMGLAYKIVVPLVSQFEAHFQIDQILISRHLRRKARSSRTDESDDDLNVQFDSRF